MALERLRGRMPIVVFVLLAVVCLAMLALACACLSDNPAKAIERAAGAGAAIPAIVELWAMLTITLGVLALVLVVGPHRRGARASPVLLQRFLF
jgi:hypothetical protein